VHYRKGSLINPEDFVYNGIVVKAGAYTPTHN